MRRAFYSAAQTGDSCDVTLVAEDGKEVWAHKIVLLRVLPALENLLCSFCSQGHEKIVVLAQGVGARDLERARDSLYLFDDKTDLENLLELPRMEEKLVEKKPDVKLFVGAGVNVDVTLTEDPLFNDKSSNAGSENTKVDKMRSGIKVKPEKKEKSSLNCNVCPFTSKSKAAFNKHILKRHADGENKKSNRSNDSNKIQDLNSMNKRIDDLIEHETIEEAIDRTHFEQIPEAIEIEDTGADFEILFEESFESEPTTSSLESLDHTNSLDMASMPTDGASNDFDYVDMRSFGDKKSFENDMERESSEKNVNTIENLGRNSPTVVEKWKEGASPMVYQCASCDFKSFTKKMLTTHMLQKHNTTYVNENFVRAKTLPDPRRMSSPMVYACLSCKFKSLTRKSLDAHMESEHKDESMNTLQSPAVNQTFSCNICSFTSNKKHTLEKHMTSEHEKLSLEEFLNESGKKRKRVLDFESPLVKRTLSMRSPFKIARTKSDANLLQKYLSPKATIQKPSSPKRDEEEFGSAMVYACKHCDFKTFLGTSLQRHTKNVHTNST